MVDVRTIKRVLEDGPNGEIRAELLIAGDGGFEHPVVEITEAEYEVWKFFLQTPLTEQQKAQLIALFDDVYSEGFREGLASGSDLYFS